MGSSNFVVLSSPPHSSCTGGGSRAADHVNSDLSTTGNVSLGNTGRGRVNSSALDVDGIPPFEPCDVGASDALNVAMRATVDTAHSDDEMSSTACEEALR